MRPVLPILLVALSAAPAAAQHAPHVHGTGELSLAIEGNVLMVSLVAPAHDLVGFEHAPSSDADRAAVLKARDGLSDGVALLGPSDDANCSLESAEVTSALLDGVEAAGDHDHGEAHHDKDDDQHGHGSAEHGHGDGDAHSNKDDDGHGHDDHAGESHSEFRAEYRFVCESPADLEALDLAYFKMYPRAEALQVRGITGKGQFSMRLTRESTRLTLPVDETE